MNKTAVEWFVEAFFEKSRISTYHSLEQDEVIGLSDFTAIVENAKEMEKEQTRNAFMEGYNAGREDATESCDAIIQNNLKRIANKIRNCDFDDAIEYIDMLSGGRKDV
jgi:hypothetical protein